MNDIEEIKNKLDIVEIVSAYVKLKQAGRNSFGLCPFHSEKTPSFSVNRELGIYKCFGCGESGDVISFIQKVEGLDFTDALKLAADKAGVKLTTTSYKKDEKYEQEKKEILKINTFTANFYNYILAKHRSGKNGLRYVQTRGFNETMIDKFKIGYATASYENLKSILLKRGYNESNAIRWGLLVVKNGKSYDKFRSRIIFPILNEFGDIVGFSGRTILKDFKGPKYLNSPETTIFKKRNLLFGLYYAKEAIRKEGFLIICEGQVDVISSHKAGISNIVAPLGTALTLEQLKVAKKYTNKIYFCFDNDTAGEKAAFRSFEMAAQLGFDLYGILIKGYHDVDDVASKKPELWKSMVFDAMDPISYLIARVADRVNIEELEGKLEVISLITPLIRNLDNEIKRDYYLKELSRLLDIDINIIYKNYGAKIGTTKTYEKEKIESTVIEKFKSDKEDYLLAILLQYFQKIKHSIKLVDEELIQKVENKKILESLRKYILEVKDTNITTFIASLPSDLHEIVEERMLFNIPDLGDTNERIAEIEMTQKKMRTEQKKEKLKLINQEMIGAEKIGDTDKIQSLQKEIQEILKA